MIHGGSPYHCAGAPAASHAASNRRSSAVMSVTLPGGMASERTALISISRAWVRMFWALSSRSPFGAAAKPAHTGSPVWHMLQRDTTMSSMAAKRGTGSGGPDRAGRGPAADSHTIAATPAAATPQVHHGLPAPAWRAL